MRKHILTYLISIVFTATGIFAQSKNAKVLFFQGKCSVLEYHTGYKKKPVTINKKINPNDIIITGRNGKVKIKLQDGSQVTVKENSRIKFSMVSKRMQRIEVRNGGILSSVKKLLNDKGYIIETPRGVAGVRGTEFVVEYEPKEDRSSVEVNSGKVIVAQQKMEIEPFAIIADGNIKYGKEIKIKRTYTKLGKEQGVSFNNKVFKLKKRQKDKERVLLYKHIDAWELN